MKLWIDDVRPAPEGYVWCKSVNGAKGIILETEQLKNRYLKLAGRWLNCHNIDNFNNYINLSIENNIELIDIDHDAGDYASDGGDYIRLLDWLEKIGRNYPIRIHSMNPVGVANMRRIIERNGWKEIK